MAKTSSSLPAGGNLFHNTLMGLNDGDYQHLTQIEKLKFDGIQDGAEVNINADWNAVSGDALILNKPATFPPSPHTHPISDVINLQTSLNLKENKSEKNVANGYAGLGANGKLFNNQLPALAITDTFVVNSQSAMLALSTAETGDIAVRSDLNKTYILKGTNPSILGDWQELLTPTDSVSSVFGRTGNVVANVGDYNTSLVPDTLNKRYQTDNQQLFNDATSSIQTQLNSKELLNNKQNSLIVDGAGIKFPTVDAVNNAFATIPPLAHHISHEYGGTDVINGENLSVIVAPPTANYSPIVDTLKGHLQGIDQALGAITQTTAGITTRIYFTGVTTTIGAGTFYTSSASGKGAVASVQQDVTNNDNQKQYFAQDLISSAQTEIIVSAAGTYAGQLSVRIDAGVAQQRYTIEVYKADNNGNPIASGISGAPVGSLGVTVAAILDSGLINLVSGNLTNITLSGILNSALTLNVGERIRYHVSAEKVGTAGGDILMSVFYGSNYNSYYDIPVIFTTDTVLNRSLVSGVTASDAINWLDANTLHKFGNETFTGIKSSTNTGTTQVNGLQFTNNGTTGSARSVNIENTASGTGQRVGNTGTGIGTLVANSGIGAGSQVSNLAGGTGFIVDNQSTGIGFTMNSTTGSTGDLLRFQKNNVTTSKFDQNGLLTATNSSATQTTGISLTNSGTSGSQVLFTSSTGGGRGAVFQSSGTSIAAAIENTGIGSGFYISNISTGRGATFDNVSTGALTILNSQTASTGDLLRFTKNGVTTSYFDQNGMFRGSNSGSTSTIGIDFTNNGTTGTKVITVTNTNTGRGIEVSNTAGGAGQVISNGGSGTGMYVLNSVGGSGINGDNTSTGPWMAINSQTGSTGDLLIFRKNSVFTTKIDQNGIITAPQFIKSGGLASEYLMANGSVSTLVNPVTGTGVSGQVSFWSGSNTQSGDQNFFWNNTNKRLGIGTNTPQTSLDIRGEGVDMLSLNQYSNTLSFGGNYSGRRYGGTKASPTATLANSVLTGLYGGGYDGTADSSLVGAIRILASNDFTNTSQGTSIDFSTTPVGSITRDVRMRINSDGTLTLVITPTTSAGSFDILTRNSSSGVIEKIPSANVQFTNTGVKSPIRTITANTTALVTDYTLLADATSNPITLGLPAASSVSGQIFCIKKINNTANNITIDPNGGELIDLAVTYTLSTYLQTVMIQSNGTAWYIIS